MYTDYIIYYIIYFYIYRKYIHIEMYKFFIDSDYQLLF